MSRRLPWETIETFPGTTPERIAGCRVRLAEATTDEERVEALVALALASYWATQVGADPRPWLEVAEERWRLADDAVALADRTGRPTTVAVARLGRLFARWGPDNLLDRGDDLHALADAHDEVVDEELRLRIREWQVLDRLDQGDLLGARAEVDRFAVEARGTGLVLFARREQLWRANLAMLSGHLDDAVAINQEVVAATADTAGSPFSFQNVAITMAIERYLRRSLEDVVEAVRSIRASSPRVGTAWDTGLAFTLAETGHHDEAAELFAATTADDLASVPRDLNWLVVTHLLGLTAVRLGDAAAARHLHDALLPFAGLDATHGSGYASYGPMARVVGQLAAVDGRRDEARRWFDLVLATRRPGPWTSLARLDRVVLGPADDETESIADADRAAAELTGFGMAAWAGEATAAAERLRLAGHGAPIARHREGRWSLRHPAGAAEVPTSRGMAHLVELLARPGEAVPVAVLDTEVDPSMPTTAAVMAPLDHAARAAYRARLGVLEDLDAPSPEEQEEMGFLRRELAGGAHARSSTELERTRVRVTKAIRRALDAVAAQSPGLGEHLSASVETGRSCLYAPADGRAWTVVDRG